MILITGITGFVGSYLAEYYGRGVVGIKRWRSPLDNIKHLNIPLYDCDLTDLSAVISVLREVKPDKIHHLAAQSYVPSSFTNPVQTLNVNVIGTVNLLEAIRITGQNPLIHICSSSEVYGQPEYFPIDEKHPTNPISPYAVSKLGEDRLGYAYWKAYGLNVVITRMFTHTGARRGEVFVCSDFAKQIAMNEKYGGNDICVGNLKSVRTVCDVRDAVGAYSLLDINMVGEVFNIGGDETMSIAQILSGLEKLSNKSYNVVVEESRMRPVDVTMQIPNCEKFREWTGWKPKIRVDETLESILEYWRERV